MQAMSLYTVGGSLVARDVPVPEPGPGQVRIRVEACGVFPYADLWQERSILSVANLTRVDGEEYFPQREAVGVRTRTTAYPLRDASAALEDQRSGNALGAAVLVP